MKHLTDQQLLRDYAVQGSEAAFTELVQRHVDLVFSAALRMVRDTHLAEDVTQQVFQALSRGAPQLHQHPVLAGWLHRTARNVAAQTVRAEVRRRTRETEATAMNDQAAPDAMPPWEQVAPHLDDALADLDPADRDAVLLRYFERKTAREMGDALGVSEEAAQKRVSRAIDRLRAVFQKRGLTVGAGALAALMSANAVHAAPAGLAAGILASSALSAAGVGVATKIIAMTTLQKSLITATLAAAVGTGLYEVRQNLQLRDELRTTLEQQQPLAARAEALQRDQEEARRQLAALQEENSRLHSNTVELPRLRSEVGRLQQRLRELAQLNAAKTGAATAPFAEEAMAWKAKETRLLQLLDQTPQQRIPELGLLDKDAFLYAARDADLDTEVGIRQALSGLRLRAENQAAIRLQAALKAYSEAHPDTRPASASELAPYADPPLDAPILERYEVKNTGADVVGGWSGGWVLSQKQLVDPEYDTRWGISPVGFGPFPATE